MVKSSFNVPKKTPVFFMSGLQGYQKMSGTQGLKKLKKREKVDNTNDTITLNSVPHPRDMDACMVGRAAAVAARERFTSAPFWSLLCDRAKQIADNFQAQDIALLLNGMTRLQIQDTELVDILLPRIEEHVAYFDLLQHDASRVRKTATDTTSSFHRSYSNRIGRSNC